MNQNTTNPVCTPVSLGCELENGDVPPVTRDTAKQNPSKRGKNFGIRNGRAFLSDEDVHRVFDFALEGNGYKETALRFGLNSTYLREIICRNVRAEALDSYLRRDELIAHCKSLKHGGHNAL